MSEKGRPSNYTEEIAQEIIERLSNGEPLRAICRSEGMPNWRTVYLWMSKDSELNARIAQAREIGFDAIAEEALYIADTPSYLDVTETITGDDDKPARIKITRSDAFNHRRLQVETRLKLLAKWCPKKYGDQIAGAEAVQITVNNVPTKTTRK